MAEQVPEAWKGEAVTIVHHGKDGQVQYRGILASLTNRGVVIESERKDQTHFFPWTSVIFIQYPAGRNIPNLQ